jgi:hypothetical protein
VEHLRGEVAGLGLLEAAPAGRLGLSKSLTLGEVEALLDYLTDEFPLLEVIELFFFGLKNKISQWSPYGRFNG